VRHAASASEVSTAPALLAADVVACALIWLALRPDLRTFGAQATVTVIAFACLRLYGGGCPCPSSTTGRPCSALSPSDTWPRSGWS
jgi:hypothetical protein